MAISSGIVVVPSCSGDRLFRLNFSAVCSVSSSSYSQWRRGRGGISVGESGVISGRRRRDIGGFLISGCLSPESSSPPPPSSSSSGSKTKLYVSGLSFRTTEDNLRNAFEQSGKLTLVNLVMDKVANRPRGFAFLKYETEEESMKAIQGMHGKLKQNMATEKQEYDESQQIGLTLIPKQRPSHYKKTDGDEEVSSVFKALPKLKDDDDAVSSIVDWRFSPIDPREKKEEKKKSDNERSLSVSTQHEIFDLSAKGQFECFSGRSQECAMGSV